MRPQSPKFKRFLPYGRNILYLLLALLAGIGCLTAITYSWDHDNATFFLLFVGVIFFPLSIGAFFLLRKALLVRNRRVVITAGAIAMLLSTFLLLGQNLAEHLTLKVLFQSLFGQLGIRAMFGALSQFLGCGLLFYAALVVFFQWLSQNSPQARLEAQGFWSFSHWRSFFLVWLFIFLCWVPYFLMLFPGVVTFDSFQQIDQILGRHPWSNHHPIIHTLLLYPFIKLGHAAGNAQAGAACFSLFQMLYMSATFAFAVRYLGRQKFHRAVPLIAMLYFALFTVNGYYSVTFWKDIPFGCMMLLFTLALVEIVRQREAFFRKPMNWVWFLASSAGVMLFRNNGLYVVLLCFPILLLFLKKIRRQVLIGAVTCAAIFALYKGPLFRLLNVTEGRAGEALSVPLQQMARVAQQHWDKLEPEDVEFYHKAFPNDENIGDRYAGDVSDPVKWQFDDEWYENNKGEFFQKWAQLGTRYPKEYIESYLYGSLGYWNPTVRRWTVVSRIQHNEYGIEQNSQLPKSLAFAEKIQLGNPRSVPVVALLYSIGFNFWLLVTVAGVLIIKRQKTWLLVLLPVATLWLTCTASPVYAEFRYIYGLFTCLPALIPLAIWLPAKAARPSIPAATE